MSFAQLQPAKHWVDPSGLRPGDYLTDGLRLFRVASRVAGGGTLLLGLEDCLTLEVRAYATDELEPMRLRIVRSGPAWESAGLGHRQAGPAT